MSETTVELCAEANGPNCNECVCRLEAGHKGQHKNFHGTVFGVIRGSAAHVAPPAALVEALVTDDSGYVTLCRRCGFVTWHEKDDFVQHEEGCAAALNSAGTGEAT